MDDTVGDNDGSIGGKSYFKTHDVSPAVSRALPCVACGAPRPLNEDWCSLAQGQGIFLREESGRAVEVSSGTAKIPEEMLEHMKFLFASFDSDSSGAAGLLCGGR